MIRKSVYMATIATSLGLFLQVSGARADVIKSYDFSGTLTNSINGSNAITGTFTVDFTTAAITAFDFSTPAGTIDPTNYLTFFSTGTGTSPSGPYVEFSFYNPGSPGHDNLGLLFETDATSFSSASSIALYPGGVDIPGGSTGAGYTCEFNGTCGGLHFSPFSSGLASLVVAPPPPPGVPEPVSLAIFGAGLAAVGFAKRKRS